MAGAWPSSKVLSRRRLMAWGAAAPSLLASGRASALVRPALPPRRLAFYHLHTGEALSIVYWSDGRYVTPSLAAIDHLLRDFHTGEVIRIDTRLLDLLHMLRRRLGSDAPIHVFSGYRSPATNAALASRSSRVAKHSLHMRGMALDLRLPGRGLPAVRQAALQLRRGGVGYYPRSGFVHVDSGQVRSW